MVSVTEDGIMADVKPEEATQPTRAPEKERKSFSKSKTARKNASSPLLHKRDDRRQERRFFLSKKKKNASHNSLADAPVRRGSAGDVDSETQRETSDDTSGGKGAAKRPSLSSLTRTKSPDRTTTSTMSSQKRTKSLEDSQRRAISSTSVSTCIKRTLSPEAVRSTTKCSTPVASHPLNRTKSPEFVLRRTRSPEPRMQREECDEAEDVVLRNTAELARELSKKEVECHHEPDSVSRPMTRDRSVSCSVEHQFLVPSLEISMSCKSNYYTEESHEELLDKDSARRSRKLGSLMKFRNKKKDDDSSNAPASPGSLRLDKIPPASVDDLSLPNFAASLYGEIKSPRERKYLKEDNRVRKLIGGQLVIDDEKVSPTALSPPTSDALRVAREEIGDNSWETETIDISTRRLNSVVASCKGNPPSNRFDHSSTIIKDTLVIFGGTDGETFKNQVFLLDLKKFVWTCPLVNGTPPPHRCGHTATQIGKHVYVHGGKNKSGYLNDTYVFDTETVTWYRVPFNGEEPPPRCYHCATLVFGDLFVVGGQSDSGTLTKDCWRLNLQTFIWSKVEFRDGGTVLRAGMTITSLQLGKYILCGGHILRKRKAKLLRTCVLLDFLNLTCHQLKTKNGPAVSHHQTIRIGRSLLLFGGYGKHRQTNEDVCILAFDVKGRCKGWTKHNFADIDETLAGQSICKHTRDTMVAFGGRNSGAESLNTLRLIRIGNEVDEATDIVADDSIQGKASVCRRRQSRSTIDPSDLTVGDIVARGASGVIRLGEFKSKEVAVKQFFVGEEEAFQSEVKMLSAVKSKYIMKYFGSYTHEDNMFMLMEYMKLGDLFRFLQEYPKALGWPLILNMALNIASGMKYLHARNILHRDLKSLNVLVCSDDVRENVNVKLMDFGDSCEIKHNMKGEITGTPRWAAPEVFSEQPFTEKSDVYSFGIILWELVQRDLPFPDIKRDMDVEKAVLAGERPRFTVASVPAPYRTLVHMCWSADPNARPTFSQIREFLVELKEKLGRRSYSGGSGVSFRSFLQRHIQIISATHRIVKRSRTYTSGESDSCSEGSQSESLSPKTSRSFTTDKAEYSSSEDGDVFMAFYSPGHSPRHQFSAPPDNLSDHSPRYSPRYSPSSSPRHVPVARSQSSPRGTNSSGSTGGINLHVTSSTQKTENSGPVPSFHSQSEISPRVRLSISGSTSSPARSRSSSRSADQRLIKRVSNPSMPRLKLSTIKNVNADEFNSELPTPGAMPMSARKTEIDNILRQRGPTPRSSESPLRKRTINAGELPGMCTTRTKSIGSVGLLESKRTSPLNISPSGRARAGSSPMRTPPIHKQPSDLSAKVIALQQAMANSPTSDKIKQLNDMLGVIGDLTPPSTPEISDSEMDLEDSDFQPPPEPIWDMDGVVAAEVVIQKETDEA